MGWKREGWLARLKLNLLANAKVVLIIVIFYGAATLFED